MTPETLVPEFSLTMKVSDFALALLERAAELELWQLLLYIVCVVMLYAAFLCLVEQLVQSSIRRSSSHSATSADNPEEGL